MPNLCLALVKHDLRIFITLLKNADCAIYPHRKFVHKVPFFFIQRVVSVFKMDDVFGIVLLEGTPLLV